MKHVRNLEMSLIRRLLNCMFFQSVPWLMSFIERLCAFNYGHALYTLYIYMSIIIVVNRKVSIIMPYSGYHLLFFCQTF